MDENGPSCNPGTWENSHRQLPIQDKYVECGVNDHTTGKSNCVSDTDKGSSCPSAFRPKCQIQPYHVCDKDCDYAPSLALALDLRP